MPAPPSKDGPRINEDIRVPRVLLIDHNGEKQGIMPTSAALEAARAGQITLLPPTAVTLAELAGHQDVASILAQRRVITPLLPRVVVEQERAWLALPEAAKYPL